MDKEDLSVEFREITHVIWQPQTAAFLKPDFGPLLRWRISPPVPESLGAGGDVPSVTGDASSTGFHSLQQQTLQVQSISQDRWLPS